jgi:hypothetical protein
VCARAGEETRQGVINAHNAGVILRVFSVKMKVNVLLSSFPIRLL